MKWLVTTGPVSSETFNLAGDTMAMNGMFATAATPGDNPRFFLQNWLANDLLDATFDAAYAIESTEHMDDKAWAFAEAFRVLRPGGRLAVCGWIAADPVRRWEVRYLLEPICREGQMPGTGTEADYRRLLAEAGFVAEAAADVSRQVRGTWGIYVRRAVGKVFTDREARADLLRAAIRKPVFMLTFVRLGLAYRTGALRYVVWRARKPG